MGPDSNEVVRIIRAVANEEIMPRFRNLAADDIAQKRGPNDLVTVADTATERRLSLALAALWPGSRVVGEEAADANPCVLQALAGAAPVWLIDPVDGTNNFASGRPCFAVIVGLCVAGEVHAGWIHDPVSGTTVRAEAGAGTFLEDRNGRRRLNLPAAKALADMTGCFGRRWSRRLMDRLKARLEPGPRFVRYGCTGREYMDLAQGRLDFAAYTRLKPWDHAAGVLIYGEAGGFGRITDTDTAYHPSPRILEATLLLARDRASWQSLRTALDLPGMVGTA